VIVGGDGPAVHVHVPLLVLGLGTHTAGGGRVTASLGAAGAGLTISDNTAGAGSLSIQRLNVSPAIDWLGLAKPAVGNQIVGNEINPVRVDGVFTGMVELRRALDGDDTKNITDAAERIKRTLESMQRVQGEMGAKAQTMLRRTDRMTDEQTSTTTMLSDVRDVDLSEAIVRFQQLQTALEANLSTSSRIMNLSLFDYLR